jgi:hypothetical protein
MDGLIEAGEFEGRMREAGSASFVNDVELFDLRLHRGK